jgi:hypothetical protein
MKNIRKHFHVILLALGLFVTMACEDLAFGDKFPSLMNGCVKPDARLVNNSAM